MDADLSIIIMCSLFSAVALTLNVTLLVLMLRHTPKSFANFGIVMKSQVIVDITTNVAGAVVMNRIIPIGNSYVYIAHGPCTLASSSVCFGSYATMVMGASMTTYIVLVSFIVRLQIVKNLKPSNQSIGVLLVVLTLPVPALMTVLFLASRSEDSVMRRILAVNLPAYADASATIFGIRDIRAPTMSVSLTLMIAVLIPLYIVILLLRSKILKCLDGTGEFLSEKTKEMHSQFVKMLTRQCVIPPVVFFASLVPLQLEYFEMIRHPLLEAMVNVLARLSTVLNPMIVLFHVAPYRRALYRWIKGGEVSTLSSAAYSARMLLDNAAEDVI